MDATAARRWLRMEGLDVDKSVNPRIWYLIEGVMVGYGMYGLLLGVVDHGTHGIETSISYIATSNYIVSQEL